MFPGDWTWPGLLNYLTFGSLYDPITLIEGVRALRPGNFLVWENGEIREEMYWDLVPGPSAANGEHTQSRAQAEEELQAVLDESVRMQMVSDVPVGVFLSGGIDSSSLAGILSRSGLQHQHVFHRFLGGGLQRSGILACGGAEVRAPITMNCWFHSRMRWQPFPVALQAMDQPIHRRTQYLSGFPAYAGSGRESGALRPWGR